MARLPSLDQRYQKFQPVAFGRAALSGHQAFDFLERPAVIPVGPDGCDFYGTALKSTTQQSRSGDYRPPYAPQEGDWKSPLLVGGKPKGKQVGVLENEPNPDRLPGQ